MVAVLALVVGIRNWSIGTELTVMVARLTELAMTFVVALSFMTKFAVMVLPPHE